MPPTGTDDKLVVLGEIAIREFTYAPRRTSRAAEFIRAEEPEAAGRFLREVEDTIGRIRAFPKSAPLRLQDIRAAALTHAPYCLHYVVESDRLVVLGPSPPPESPAQTTKKSS